MTLGPAYGSVEFPVGTAAAPSIYGDTDPDTGWSWLGSNVLVASAGGAEKVRITTTGLGIGRSPNYALHAYHATVDEVARFESGDAGVVTGYVDNSGLGYILYSGADQRFSIKPANVEWLRVENSGVRIENAVAAAPDSTAILDVVSTTKGLLPPRMTTTQRDNISSPATGLQIYNTTTNKINVYTGAGWEAVTSA